MMKINEFCSRLCQNMRGHLQERSALRGLYQDEYSCKALVKACIDIEPDYIVEIGTDYGLSTLSLAYAMKLLDKELSDLTTTDISHDLWEKSTPQIQSAVLMSNEINIGRIRTVTGDFLNLDPPRFKKKGRVLVFYDIHDVDSAPSYAQKFLDEWIPLFDHGYVMFHDFCTWPKKDSSGLPHSAAKHFSGLSFEGFKECKVVIDWLNERDREIKVFPNTSILKFQL